jgi:hypothetical protein
MYHKKLQGWAIKVQGKRGEWLAGPHLVGGEPYLLGNTIAFCENPRFAEALLGQYREQDPERFADAHVIPVVVELRMTEEEASDYRQRQAEERS